MSEWIVKGNKRVVVMDLRAIKMKVGHHIIHQCRKAGKSLAWVPERVTETRWAARRGLLVQECVTETGLREHERGRNRPVISCTDENGSNVNGASNNARVRVSNTVENGAGLTMRECVVGEGRPVVMSEPEIMSIGVAEEVKIRETIGAGLGMRCRGLSGVECEVAISNYTPSVRGGVLAEWGEHRPELPERAVDRRDPTERILQWRARWNLELRMWEW
jgi:hypothetical protein